jgi:MFS transporter, DHA1 family, inner membrane transport protein
MMNISAKRLQAMRWSLLLGNFFIGCGVMVVGGALNDLSADLHVTVSAIGELIAVAAVMMGVGAPVLATLVSRVDRRLLLAGALVWYAIGHALCALSHGYDNLLPIRALTVLAAAVFTPQAAAVVGFLAPPESRGRAITFVFFGWAMAAVVGMPMAAWVGERLGWEIAMLIISAGSLLAAAQIFRTLPHGIRPPATSLRAWRSVFSSPVLIGTVMVTALQSAGQMTMVGFCAAYLKVSFSANPEQISAVFAYFGIMSMTGVLVLNRWVDKLSPPRAVNIALGMMWITMLLWPLAQGLSSLVLIMLPWALAGFATSSGQQARLTHLSPERAPALMSLNTSAIYLGHAAGAAGGGWAIAHHGYASLHWPALFWASLAWGMSVWAHRASQSDQSLRSQAPVTT